MDLLRKTRDCQKRAESFRRPALYPVELRAHKHLQKQALLNWQSLAEEGNDCHDNCQNQFVAANQQGELYQHRDPLASRRYYGTDKIQERGREADDGTLEIDNLIENTIRPSALGKKNWLFVGHPEAGERSAVIYTPLGSCRRHGINPCDYLKDLFTRLPAAKITQIKEFTPAAWARAKAKEQVVA
jgi:hypothetical protein